MGLFSKSNKSSVAEDALAPSTSSTDDTYKSNFSNTITETSAATEDQPRKKSLYARYRDLKRGPGPQISDEDLQKYTGMNRTEFDKWAATTPGVAGGQAAGDITAGGTSHIAIASGSGSGFGGWGTEAGKKPTERRFVGGA